MKSLVNFGYVFKNNHATMHTILHKHLHKGIWKRDYVYLHVLLSLKYFYFDNIFMVLHCQLSKLTRCSPCRLVVSYAVGGSGKRCGQIIG